MTPDANKKLISDIQSAISRGELDVLDRHPGYHETRRVMPMIEAAFPDLTWTIASQVAEGDLVATHRWLEGTHLGEFVGIAPTGRRIRIQNVSMDRVVDGVVVEHNGESGWFSLLFELGVLPVRR